MFPYFISKNYCMPFVFIMMVSQSINIIVQIQLLQINMWTHLCGVNTLNNPNTFLLSTSYYHFTQAKACGYIILITHNSEPITPNSSVPFSQIGSGKGTPPSPLPILISTEQYSC
jgi:hypothetical protein